MYASNAKDNKIVVVRGEGVECPKWRKGRLKSQRFKREEKTC